MCMYSGVIFEWWMWSEEGWRWNLVSVLACSYRNELKGSPGLRFPSDGHIAVNNIYAFTSHSLWRDLGFLLGIFGTETIEEVLLHHPWQSQWQGERKKFLPSRRSNTGPLCVRLYLSLCVGRKKKVNPDNSCIETPFYEYPRTGETFQMVSKYI